MAWSKPFKTSDPENGKETSAKVKTDDKGYVSDIIYGVERDKPGDKKHGHIWGLNSDNDNKISGRDKKK